MRLFAFIISAWALNACAQPVADAPVGPSPFVANTRTILVGESAENLSHQCSRASPGPIEGQWTPAEADLAALEPPLAALLAERIARDPHARGAAADDYYRQYAGFIIGGRRVIYVNGVARSAVEGDPNPEHPFDWRTQAIGICDGGPITFGVEYDPATHAFTNFAFNGALG